MPNVARNNLLLFGIPFQSPLLCPLILQPAFLVLFFVDKLIIMAIKAISAN
jgi:hypothetical protein